MATARTRKAALQRSVDQSALPVYLVTSQLQIAYANPATSQWIGLDEESLTELTCVYQSSAENPPSDQIGNGLCPPPDCFDGSPREFFVYRPGSGNREPEFRKAISCPAGPEHDSVLVTVFGDPRNNPESPWQAWPVENTRLHAAIAQMQYESALQINIDLVAGRSPAAEKIRRQIRLAGQSASSLLICGPPGSGRRQVAQLVHFAQGPAMAGPLIPIDCPVVDAEGMQSVVKELYREQHKHPEEPLGRLLLLDVDGLMAEARAELTGFLKLPDFDLPLLATGGPDCRARLEPELWEMLSTLVIELAALAERRPDIPFLLQALVEQGNMAGSAQFSGLDAAALECLNAYAWPGQLNEMIQVVTSARARATPPVIRVEDLPAHVRIAVRAQADAASERQITIDLDQFLAEIESELIERAVACAQGNKSRAARLLGISRPRLLRRLGEEPADGQPAPGGDSL